MPVSVTQEVEGRSKDRTSGKRRKANTPDALIIEINRQNPRLTQNEQAELFCNELYDNRAFINEIGHHYHSLRFRTLTQDPDRKEKPMKTDAERQADVDRIRQGYLTAALQTVTLESIMPNAKRLRDCTGKEMLGFGGIFLIIGGSVKPNQKIGTVFKTDEELRKAVDAA